MSELFSIPDNWKRISNQVAESAIACGRNPDSVTIGGIMFAMSEVADFLCGGVILILVLFFSSLE